MQGLRKQTLSKTGRTARNLRPSGYDVFAHQHDQSFFYTPSFLALTTERVGTRLRVYPPGKHSLCPTLSHVKTQKRGLRNQTLNKTGRTMSNLRLGGYGIFAHQRDQSFFPHLGLFGLSYQRGRCGSKSISTWRTFSVPGPLSC